jgi:hypothetical protein
MDKETKAHRARAQKAWGKRDEWNAVLTDVYDFVAPHRQSTRLNKSAPSQRTSRIFDNHAMTVAQRVTGRLLEDVFPSGEPLVALEPGVAITDEKDREEAFKECATHSDLINACFWQGGFDDAAAGMIFDGIISTGFMLALDGDAACPVKWVNVPHDEVAVDSGPYNRLHGFFWKSQWNRRKVMEAFPKGKFSDTFKRMAESKGEEEVTLCQDTIFDAKSGQWKLCVYLEGAREENIWTEEYDTCRWIAFRYFCLPGEDYGFGPVLMNLPLIKTLNKTTEIALKGAMLAAMGIYTMIDDGVFNPDTARLEPGALWKVARNGGPLGPSIARLPSATDANLNMVSIQDLRASISAGMNDQELPAEGGTPRSAAEIIERSRRLRINHSGAFARIVNDIFMAIIPATQEILVRQNVLKKTLKVDQLAVRMKVLSPLGRAFRARRAENFVDWLQVVGGVAGPESMRMVTPLEPSLVQLGRDMGVEEARLRPVSQQEELAQRVQEGVAAAMEAMQQQAAAGAPPPANGDPAQAAA